MSGEASVLPKEELHVVSQGKEQVLFHVPTFNFFTINPAAAEFLRAYTNGLPLPDCRDQCGVRQRQVEGLFTSLRKQREREMAEFRESLKKREEKLTDCPPQQGRTLERLTLNVSNDCNLRCRYCYAGGGAYGMDRSLMTPEVALRAIDAVYAHFAGLGGIQFFGGEPGLNVPVIRAVCEYTQQLHKEGKIEHPPGYGMVTNGTVHSPEFLEVLREYKIGATVSLDGPPEVNDAVRVYHSGGGTFQRIVSFIRMLQERAESWVGVEGTYTRVHLEQGVSMVDLMDFFADELKIRSPHIPPVGAPADPALALYPEYTEQTEKIYADAVTHTIQSATTGHWRSLSLAERQVRALAQKRGMPFICPASGTATLSMAANGDIYPCFMFVGKPEFRMGSVLNGGFSGPGFERVDGVFQANAKMKRDDCRACWARGLCSGCLGANCSETGSIYEVPAHHCGQVKAMGERTLMELSRVKRKPKAWKKLVENMTHWPQRTGEPTEEPGTPA
jgi:uncharacterized protein